ncbi:MAG: hypothetical protein MUF47_06020 [Porphyrobacter sp.]|jgi:hypothetical protein|nr:hypothetical protein [Porphyrobacter sp.]
MTKQRNFRAMLALSEAEYQSMNSGINIVFGAVLGVVLTKTEDMAAADFMFVLASSAIAVSQILLLGLTRERRLQYVLTAAGAIIALPFMLESVGITAIPKLQPTLIVWTAMVLLIELSPRKPDPGQDNKEPSQ